MARAHHHKELALTYPYLLSLKFVHLMDSIKMRNSLTEESVTELVRALGKEIIAAEEWGRRRRAHIIHVLQGLLRYSLWGWYYRPQCVSLPRSQSTSP